MIEIPRACWVADEIAKHARVLQFRHERPHPDDVRLQPRRRGGGLPPQVTSRTRSCPRTPFQTLDVVIADEMRMAVEKGRSTRPDLKVGICGEARRRSRLDPQSARPSASTTSSCSPFRVPVARLAAAQAVLVKRGRDDGSPRPSGAGPSGPGDRPPSRPAPSSTKPGPAARASCRPGWDHARCRQTPEPIRRRRHARRRDTVRGLIVDIQPLRRDLRLPVCL